MAKTAKKSGTKKTSTKQTAAQATTTQPTLVPTVEHVEAAIGRSVRANTILERCVCLTLERHYFGNDRQISVDKVIEAANGQTDMLDGKQIHATKRLIPTDEILPVKRLFWTEAESKLKRKAIPGHRVFGNTSFLIPLATVEELDADLVKAQTTIHEAAVALGERYADAIERQRVALGPLFNEADYVSKAALIDSFSLDWSYVRFGAPERLEAVNHVLAANAERKHTQKLERAYDEVLYGLRESAAEVLGDLEERLTPKADGKARTIRGTALRDLEEFIKYLPARNMTDDDKLPAIMARVQARAQGLSVETLRDDVAARESLRAVVAEAKAAVGELVEVTRRGINFGSLSAA